MLLEESILGWKEYELELMRDKADNVVVVCSIENVDPMGVHTGDSITVAPAMTLTDREYQRLRDIAIDVIRAVGVDTGGCNIQFAVDPVDGRVIVIEMNPRVSRSSALASQGHRLPDRQDRGEARDRLHPRRDPQRHHPGDPGVASSRRLDYVVVKVPRFAFEKFPGADPMLTTHMKSVGEAMAIGRSFTEALQKALRSLETPGAPFSWEPSPVDAGGAGWTGASVPHDGRLGDVQKALRAGATVEQVHEATGIDPWFVDQVRWSTRWPPRCATRPSSTATCSRRAKRHGFSDAQLGRLRGMPEDVVRGVRHALGVCGRCSRPSTPAPPSSPR